LPICRALMTIYYIENSKGIIPMFKECNKAGITDGE